MHRCFVDEKIAVGCNVFLEENEARHVAKVLRLQKGNSIEVCNGSGRVYTGQILQAGKSEVSVLIIGERESHSEPKTEVWLFQGLSKGTKMDLVIQKSVELGVCGIVPVETDFSVVKIDEGDSKSQRWRKIAWEAAKQCKRAVVPEVLPPMPFWKAVQKLRTYEKALLAYEKEEKVGIKHALMGSYRSCGIMIGPEGGFSPKEIASLEGTGIQTVSLGNRILRTETAAVSCLSVIMYDCGEFGIERKE